jgi:hypothetical protein
LIGGCYQKAVTAAVDNFVQDDVGSVDQGALLPFNPSRFSAVGPAEGTVRFFDMPDRCPARISE